MPKINDGDYTFLVLSNGQPKILDAEKKISVLDERLGFFNAAYKLNLVREDKFEKITSVKDVLKAMSFDYPTGLESETDCSDKFYYTQALASEIANLQPDNVRFKLSLKEDNADSKVLITSDNIYIKNSEINRIRTKLNPLTRSTISTKRQEVLIEYLTQEFPDIMMLPHDSKQKVKAYCLTIPGGLFTSSTFDSTWKAASSSGLISLHNRARYARRV